MTPSLRLVGGRGRSGGGASPVHHGASVEGHEEDLAAASRTHRGKEHLERGRVRRALRKKKNHSLIIVHK